MLVYIPAPWIRHGYGSPNKNPQKTRALRSHGQLLADMVPGNPTEHRVEITIHGCRGTIPAHEEATFPGGGQGPDLDSPGTA